ncbi:MAG: EamA family transporter [Chloroflexota bacterium]
MDIASLLVLVGSGLVQGAGSVLLKYATLYEKGAGGSQAPFLALMGLAMVLFTVGGLLFARGLARMRLSVAQPVFSATIFLMVTACSVLVFHEQLSALQLAGMATILGGILLVIV